METKDGEAEKDTEVTLDLSKQSLKRVEHAKKEHLSTTNLILDYNEIQKLDNLETYPNLKKLSIVSNQLIRMYAVSNLIHVVVLDLSQNAIVSIEGLKDMVELKILKLAKNKIKTIEHLNNNLKLEVLDLSENNILRISDISYLTNLKELYLHENRIINLNQSEKKLPNNLEILTLNNNNLTDLNEVSHLSGLTSLKELSIANNPCLNFSENQKFNYRPFVKNWCCNLIVLDYSLLDDIECLKAEWLYSQGRGRSFKTGEQAALVEYLVSVCPREKEENAETEDVKKLKLILSKAQLHQQQLREQITAASASKSVPGESFKSQIKKKAAGMSERMVSSFQDSPEKDLKNSSDVMTQSLDSGIKKKTFRVSKTEPNQTPLQTSTSFVPIPDTLISPDVGQPVGINSTKPSSVSSRTSRSSSRNSPILTPESKRKSSIIRRQYESSSPVTSRGEQKLNYSSSSPPHDGSGGKSLASRSLVTPERKAIKSRAISRNYKETSEEEDSETLRLKLKNVNVRGSQKKQEKTVNNSKKTESSDKKRNVREKTLTHTEEGSVSSDMWKAAVCIQRRWRGYRARNLNGEVLSGCKNIQMDRIQDYLTKVLNDMESTRVALEGNRKLVVLQMQAINALWKRMSSLQPAVGSQSDDNKKSLQDLVETCSTLNKQVEALQIMMKNLQGSSPSISSVPMATQTEIVAVHTPQDETQTAFPYNQKPKSPTPESSTTYSTVEEKEHRENAFDSGNDSTTATLTEIYTNCCFNEKELSDTSKTSSRSNPLKKEFSFITESLSKPSVNLSIQDNEVPPLLNEIEIPETETPIEGSCES